MPQTIQARIERRFEAGANHWVLIGPGYPLDGYIMAVTGRGPVRQQIRDSLDDLNACRERWGGTSAGLLPISIVRS